MENSILKRAATRKSPTPQATARIRDHIGNRRHQLRQYLQIRLRYGDHKAKQKAKTDHHRKAPGLRQAGSHPFAHDGHGHLRA